MEENNRSSNTPPVLPPQPEQDNTSQVSISPKSKYKKIVLIGFLILIGVVVLYVGFNVIYRLLGGGVGHSFPVARDSDQTTSPTLTPDPTANWKTYTNTEFGFSFKYPKQLTISEKRSKEEIKDFVIDGGTTNVIDYEYRFSTGKIVNGVEEVSGFSISIFPTSGKTIGQEFSGENAMGVIGVTPIDKRGADEAAHVTNIQANVVYRKGNNFFEVGGLQVIGIPSDFEQILSTFKFTTNEDVVKKLIEENQMTENPLKLDAEQSLAIDRIKIDPASVWAIVEAHIVDKNGNIGSEGIIIILKKESNQWVIFNPGDSNYETTVRNVPESIMSSEAKRYLLSN